LYKIFGAKISNPKASFVVFGAKILYEKCARNLMMKLTPDRNDEDKKRLSKYLFFHQENKI